MRLNSALDSDNYGIQGDDFLKLSPQETLTLCMDNLSMQNNICCHSYNIHEISYRSRYDVLDCIVLPIVIAMCIGIVLNLCTSLIDIQSKPTDIYFKSKITETNKLLILALNHCSPQHVDFTLHLLICLHFFHWTVTSFRRLLMSRYIITFGLVNLYLCMFLTKTGDSFMIYAKSVDIFTELDFCCTSIVTINIIFYNDNKVIFKCFILCQARIFFCL